MATSQLDLYVSQITPQKNAKIDDIELYLGHITRPRHVLIDNFQYIKNDLNITIKIDRKQAYLDEDSIKFNYARVKNTDGDLIYYYFIVSSEWISQTCVKLTLLMDTINTFWSKFVFTSATNIEREHKDRFAGSYISGSNSYAYNIVDKASENFQPLLNLDSKSKIIQSQLSDLKWYLIYKTRNNMTPDDYNNPIDCYLCANKIVKIGGPIKIPYTTSALANHYYYFLLRDNYMGCNITVGSELLTLGGTIRTTNNITDIVVYLSGTGSISVKYKGAGENVYTTLMFDNITSFTVNKMNWYYYEEELYNDPDSSLNETDKLRARATRIPVYISGIDALDRTDSRNMKVIEIPYAPCIVSFNTDHYELDNNWIYDQESNYMKLANLNAELINTDIISISLPSTTLIPVADSRLSTLRDSKYETKLYHSDYYNTKVVYDSFSTDIKLENYTHVIPDEIPLEFKPTNTINSRFIINVIKNATEIYKNNSDYENIMVIDRNNEISLYNNEYINYIRTGYNYDRKQQILNNTNSWLKTGASLVGTSISLIKLKQPLAATYAGLQTATSLSDAIVGTIQSEDNIQQKLIQYSYQAATVSGSNDLDLLNYYTDGNKAWKYVYTASDEVKQKLVDLFYYTGYSYSHQGIPDFDSRCWFNYVKCDPCFNDETVFEKYIDDIKGRFNIGITDFHRKVINGSDTWNLVQTLENWETWLIN